MSRPFAFVALFALVGTLAAADDEGALLSKLCYGCHSIAKHKGDFDMESLGAPSDRADRVEHWEKVRENLADQVMPPAEKPQPSLAERERMVAWIDRALDGPDGAEPKDPGWTTVRRLTGLEFNRTIHDLLGVDGSPADAFPADNAGGSGGFDNNADGLFVSPLLMERLLDVALGLIEKAKPDRLGIVAPVKDKTGAETPAAKHKAVEASLTAFLPRAWRRPVSVGEVQSLARVYDRSAKKNNVTHEDALRLTYAAALTSPNFLFRIEAAKAGKDAYPVSAYELAVRLSYFLWSTMPDDTLTALAKDGTLTKPEVLAAQTKRLLADPRADIMIRQFTGQWLGTDDLASGSGPDPKQFPAFTDSLRKSMVEEPVAFMTALLKDNRSLLDLIDCDYAYVNAELARHYDLGAAAASGAGFTRVQIGDGRRGGVVTMAGVLAITSRPARTSPVLRGKWILNELLSAPPPPPPPNVPALIEATGGDVAKLGTLRQRLEKHRADPACNSCHQRIDPLGFGLENFDALGRWRDRGDGGAALDTIGTLPAGETFNGPKELKKILMQRKERVMTTVIERMLSYALGRHLERFDRPTIRRIQTNLAADGYKAQTLISEIVQSLPFRFKRNPPVAGPAPTTTAVKDKDKP